MRRLRVTHSFMSPHFIGRLAAGSTTARNHAQCQIREPFGHIMLYISKFPGLLSTSCVSEHTQSHELKLIVSSEY